MYILFPFLTHIQETKNISFEQATIKSSNPIVTPEHPWEGHRTHLYGSVIKEDEHYTMWYQNGNALRFSYATSTDALHWDKPLFNHVAFDERNFSILDPNDEAYKNPIPTNIVSTFHMPTVIKDKNYKLFGFGEGGYRVAYSDDGKIFKEIENNPIIPYKAYPNPHTKKTWYNDVSPLMHDQKNDQYVAFTKTYTIDHNNITRRCVGYATSNDFEHWSNVETIWTPSYREDTIAKQRGFNWSDFYGLCGFNYGDHYLAFLWLFEIEKELPRGTNQGIIEVFLAQSIDGKTWDLVSDTPFIPYDLNFTESDGGMVTTPNSPIFEEDGIRVFYSDSNFLHGFVEKDFTKKYDAPTFVTRQQKIRKEGFVGAFSLDGSITTNMVSLYQKQIRLNLDASNGKVVIKLQQGKHLFKRFTLQNIDQTDYLIDPSFDYDCQITIELFNATLFALEVIPTAINYTYL